MRGGQVRDQLVHEGVIVSILVVTFAFHCVLVFVLWFWLLVLAVLVGLSCAYMGSFPQACSPRVPVVVVVIRKRRVEGLGDRDSNRCMKPIACF